MRSADDAGLTKGPACILHIEVGGSYGGSAKALETFLKYSDRQRLCHDVLFHREPPQAGALRSFADRVYALEGPATAKPEHNAPGGTPADAGLFKRLGRPIARTRAAQQLFEAASLLRAFPLVRRIRRIIEEGGYDVAHVNNTFTYGAPGLLAAWLAGKPVLAHVRNPVDPSPLARWLASKASCIVSVNQRYASELRAAGITRPIQTVLDAVEAEEPSPREVARVRRELLPEGGILIGAVGRLDRQKDYETLIEAAAIVRRTHPNARFVVAGEGPLRVQLQDRIARLGLGGGFLLAGFRTDATALTAALDVLVSSSLWEGLPLSLIVAALLERPIVSTAVGGIPELIRPGESGLLVAPGAPMVLAGAIDTVIQMGPEKKRGLGLAARRSAERFTDAKGLAAELDTILIGSALAHR